MVKRPKTLILGEKPHFTPAVRILLSTPRSGGPFSQPKAGKFRYQGVAAHFFNRRRENSEAIFKPFQMSVFVLFNSVSSSNIISRHDSRKKSCPVPLAPLAMNPGAHDDPGRENGNYSPARGRENGPPLPPGYSRVFKTRVQSVPVSAKIVTGKNRNSVSISFKVPCILMKEATDLRFVSTYKLLSAIAHGEKRVLKSVF